MSGKDESLRATAEAMLSMVAAHSFTIDSDRDRFSVTIGGTAIVLGNERPYAFERLAAAIETRIAYERAAAMVAAAGESGVPLWLVAGPGMLGSWLQWSRTASALARTLALTDRAGTAPVVGHFARRARHRLGQMGVRIRVCAGQAIAERIELSHRIPAVGVLGERATVRIARQHLPDTLHVALREDPSRNDRWRAGEIIGHPFFAAHDMMVEEVRQEESDVVVELETEWAPLAPVPKEAWTAVPRDADPRFPWRATQCEVTELYRLAARGDRLIEKQRRAHGMVTAPADPR